MNIGSSGTPPGGGVAPDGTVPADGQDEPGPARIVAPTPPAVRRQGGSGAAPSTGPDDQPPSGRSRFFEPEGTEKPAADQATHGSGRRNAEASGSDDHALPRGRDKPMGKG